VTRPGPSRAPSAAPSSMVPGRIVKQPIVLGADHGGFELKQILAASLRERGQEVIDIGCHTSESVDYPDIAESLVAVIAAGRADRGILVCGTGIGISIAANRHPDIRAALCHDTTTARLARAHNNANVLALGARVIGPATAIDCMDTFLATAFEGGRHARRVGKLG
jgi:ribose 5-phosphate isomerase B